MASLIFPNSVEYTVFCISHIVHCLKLGVVVCFFFFFNFSQLQVVVSEYFRTIQALVELESINIIKTMVV